MTVDIYIREKKGGREIRVPWLPEKIDIASGDTVFASYDIMNRGEVAVPTGTGLMEITWDSELPGKYRTDDAMLRGTWKAPSAYISILESWKTAGTPLVVLVTGYPVNKDVVLAAFEWTAVGGFGDVEYSITFQERREIVITSTVSATPKATVRTTEPTTTYTIVSGDTLWAIAKAKLGAGSKWETIYNANKEIIESTAKKYGKSSSNKGWWIYPGTKLTIPA